MSFLRKIVPAGVYNMIRSAILFKPKDRNNLLQVLPQREVNVDVERIKGYRYPAPGSRTGASVPIRESEDEVYDTKFYSRDSRNLPKQDTIGINTSAAEPVLIAQKVHKGGSVGNKNPAVMLYDPSGLRSTMSANWPALDAAVQKYAKPNHLPSPEWINSLAAIEAEAEKKGIPVALGRPFKPVGLSPNYNEVKW